jgi:hypothetical protein
VACTGTWADTRAKCAQGFLLPWAAGGWLQAHTMHMLDAQTRQSHTIYYLQE